jgi:hypothetical protein
MRYVATLFFVVILVVSNRPIKAQTFEIGAAAGGAGYLGDLNQNNPLKISGISAGAFVKMNLDRNWVLGAHYYYGQIRGNDANSSNEYFKKRNLNFLTPLNEVTIQVDFNFLDYFSGGGFKTFTPYIYAGLGGVIFNPKATYGDETYALRFYATEGQTKAYKNFTVSIPYGAGFKMRLKDAWGLTTNVGYRSVNTDYLDDVSKNYPGPGAWDGRKNEQESYLLSDPTDPKIGVAGTQRGDFRKRDTYMFVGIGISYTFVSQKCYTF